MRNRFRLFLTCRIVLEYEDNRRDRVDAYLVHVCVSVNNPVTMRWADVSRCRRIFRPNGHIVHLRRPVGDDLTTLWSRAVATDQ
jgi:hypothetical protein